MYGQLTTGKPTRIVSRTGAKSPAHQYEIVINTTKNRPEVVKDQEVEWESNRGTMVEIEMEARYLRGRQSVDEYLRQTALTNPHLNLSYRAPDGKEVVYERTTKELPPEAIEVKPHPHGVELGALMKMMQDTSQKSVQGFLTKEFCRVSSRAAKEFCDKAEISPKARPRSIARVETDRLYKAINETKLMKPPTTASSPSATNCSRAVSARMSKRRSTPRRRGRRPCIAAIRSRSRWPWPTAARLIRKGR